MPKRLTKLLVATANGSTEIKELDFNNLNVLQDIVGGYCQRIRVVTRPGLFVWCNEDGVRLRLPHNEALSKIAGKTILGNGFVEGPADMLEALLNEIPA